jgi:hypothetical protein
MFICFSTIATPTEDSYGRYNGCDYETQILEKETIGELYDAIALIKIEIMTKNPNNKYDLPSVEFSPIYEVWAEHDISEQKILNTKTWVDHQASVLAKLRLEEEKRKATAERVAESERLKELARHEADMETYRRMKAKLENQEGNI